MSRSAGGNAHHKSNCSCSVCKAQRRELVGEDHPRYGRTGGTRALHKEGCICYYCKSKRGEYKGKNSPMYSKKNFGVSRKNKKDNVMKRLTVARKQGDSLRKRWQEPEFKERMIRIWLKASHVKPNKAELKLNEVLQQILPNEYKYVGNGEFIIAGKCPDFININGQKKIIELFGDYWHKGDTGEDRINLFKQYGYETLIIWEHELKNIEGLKNKILDFQTGG